MSPSHSGFPENGCGWFGLDISRRPVTLRSAPALPPSGGDARIELAYRHKRFDIAQGDI